QRILCRMLAEPSSCLFRQLRRGETRQRILFVRRDAVESMATKGLRIDDKKGGTQVIRVQAQTDPAKVGPVDLVVVFVKCMHTEAAIRSAEPLLGPETVVMTLQNGWGNAARLAEIVGKERIVTGLTYQSSTVLGPGHLRHTAEGPTIIGELNGDISHRLERIGEVFSSAGIEVTLSKNITKDIWEKLLMTVCLLPIHALLRFESGELIKHEGALQLMRGLLHEAVIVAKAQGIDLDEEKHWEIMVETEKNYAGAKASMVQDIENRRRTEIDVISGAVVEAGKRLNIPTPYNQVMVWLIKSLEETFDS
ncbi:MAG: 2-dehydropantoate 2-reductase, partial [Acidobacteria bacterium]|nr:2-dehydropantoate 2-reductase [Acidobacteriota bacterium]MCI0719145.1 2-dehydropantoate 2-reductase [Acidobacteriota bacterium]